MLVAISSNFIDGRAGTVSVLNRAALDMQQACSPDQMTHTVTVEEKEDVGLHRRHPSTLA